ncbi:MAG TPA: hypothetical protein PK441_11210, partial [Burkholderiaceae bacterium]|nr:hypothetical protein [Burkholderiaceae bacterium]
MLGCKAQLEHRRAGLEHLRQHAGGQRAGQLPAAFGAFVGGQLVALFQGDGHAVVHQQVVVGQKAGEQHAVPVLVGHLLGEVVHGLHLAAVQGIAQLPAVGAQAAAQLTVLFAQVSKGRGLTHTKLFQRGTGGV